MWHRTSVEALEDAAAGMPAVSATLDPRAPAPVVIAPPRPVDPDAEFNTAMWQRTSLDAREQVRVAAEEWDAWATAPSAAAAQPELVDEAPAVEPSGDTAFNTPVWQQTSLEAQAHVQAAAEEWDAMVARPAVAPTPMDAPLVLQADTTGDDEFNTAMWRKTSLEAAVPETVDASAPAEIVAPEEAPPAAARSARVGETASSVVGPVETATPPEDQRPENDEVERAMWRRTTFVAPVGATAVDGDGAEGGEVSRATVPGDGRLSDPASEPARAAASAGWSSEGSSTGIPSRLAAALAYTGGCITGLLFLLLERRDTFVRFHAAQSAIVLGVGWMVGAAFWAAAVNAAIQSNTAVPTLSRLAVVLWLGLAPVCALGMINAATGHRWAVPGIGRLATWLAERRARDERDAGEAVS
ncbi:MAG: hypothetical protein U0Q12_16020 [Vicinamibacterales bacterium]